MVFMIYTFHEDAGAQTLHLKGEHYKYLIKVRRHTQGDKLAFRDKKHPEAIHIYEIKELEPRSALLVRCSSEVLEVKSKRNLHIAWCVIDNKSVEKVLPSLCEIGVSRISFINCERSQKNFKPDFKRLNRIVDASMQQSGRSERMVFDNYKNLATFIEEFPQTRVFDFTEKILGDVVDFTTVLIGCEGGFSPVEKEHLKTQEVFRLNTPMVLRSESAAVAVASKILL